MKSVNADNAVDYIGVNLRFVLQMLIIFQGAILLYGKKLDVTMVKELESISKKTFHFHNILELSVITSMEEAFCAICPAT